MDGWPAGNFLAQVRFTNSNSDDAGWWYTGYSKNKNHVYNLFGRGSPNDSKSLNIDLQFNFPVNTFKSTQGGVFLRDTESGTIVLGHRGIVTRGKSRVPRNALFQEADLSPVEISSGKSRKPIHVLLDCWMMSACQPQQTRHHHGVAVCDAAMDPRIIGLTGKSRPTPVRHYLSKLLTY